MNSTIEFLIGGGFFLLITASAWLDGIDYKVKTQDKIEERLGQWKNMQVIVILIFFPTVVHFTIFGIFAFLVIVLPVVAFEISSSSKQNS